MRLIDLHHVSRARTIGCWQVDDVLIDCGPATCLDRLLEELGDWTPRALLLTHIHLDHAGAAGQLAERWPELEIHVHERGARHLADPSRLVSSATQLYGEEDMARLWGEVAPTPAERLHPLSGGETVGAFRVAYTPGHASHHVSFLHEESGRAFVGDVAGVRIVPGDMILPHAPPPDIDIPAWERSLDQVLEWQPESLGLPHFGVVEDVHAHVEGVRRRLRYKAQRAEELTLEDFVRESEEELAGASPDLRDAYRAASPPDHMYLGLRRYLDKR